MSFANSTRRLGDRHAVRGIVVDWNTNGRRRTTIWRRRFEDADVIDVSVTGAQLLAPRDPYLQIGDRITLAVAGSLGQVRIIRVADVTNGKLSVYGVEFLWLEKPIEACLFSQIGRQRPRIDEATWRTAD